MDKAQNTEQNNTYQPGHSDIAKGLKIKSLENKTKEIIQDDY